MRALAGVGVESAWLSFYTRNRFELWRKLPPEIIKHSVKLQSAYFIDKCSIFCRHELRR